MRPSSPQESVVVGIVGGGIGGLALAKMLEMAGVSYLLFEAHELVPESGASIGLMPSGLRILDQIGVIDEIEKWSVKHDCWEHRDGETGELYTTTKASRAYPDLFGYGAFFMDRRRILSILFNSIQDKSRLHAFKKVVEIENLEDKAIVKCANGEVFACQVVAGADGVHSTVRKFVREQIPEPLEVDPNYLSAESYCVFGISASISSIGEGRYFTIYNREASVLVFSGLNGKLYWFVFKSLEESLKYGQRRKFTDDDTEATCALVSDVLLTEGVHFSDVLERGEYKITLSLEQGICESWFAGRMFLLGDATHKVSVPTQNKEIVGLRGLWVNKGSQMAPHAAMGANLAFESAACFVNNLLAIRETHGNRNVQRIPQDQLHQCLASYAEQRRDRVTSLTELARGTQRVQLRIGPESDTFIKALPGMNDDDWLVKGFVSFSQAEKLEDWRWNSDRVEKYNSVAKRALVAAKNGKEREMLRSLMIS